MFRTRVLAATTAGFLTLGMLATSAGAAPTKTVPAKKWAKGVCPALADFVNTFAGIGAQLTPDLSPEKAQQVITDGLDSVVADVDAVLAAVRKAGTPDTSKGTKAVATFTTEFKKIKHALVDGQGIVAGIPTDDPNGFADAAGELESQVQDKLGASLEKIDKADKAVSKALDSDATCKAAGE